MTKLKLEHLGTKIDHISPSQILQKQYIMSNNDIFRDQQLNRRCQELNFDFETIKRELRTKKFMTMEVNYGRTLVDSDVMRNMMLGGALKAWKLYEHACLDVNSYVSKHQQFLRSDMITFMTKYAEQLNRIIKPELDFNLSYFAISTYMHNYLCRIHVDAPIYETPQLAILRIICGELITEQTNETELLNKISEYYKLYAEGVICGSSPTYYNMGFKKRNPISCILAGIEDNIESILFSISEGGINNSKGAGLGIDASLVRHSETSGAGLSAGIIPIMIIWDHMINYVNQGNKRRGAATMSLRSHHIDLPEFIRVIDKTNQPDCRVERLDTAIFTSDAFMKAVANKDTWYLFCPKQTEELNGKHGIEFERLYQEFVQMADTWDRYKDYTIMKELFEDNRENFDKLSQFQQDRVELNDKYLQLKQEFGHIEDHSDMVPRRVYSRKIRADLLMENICDMQIKAARPYIVHGCRANTRSPLKYGPDIPNSNLCVEILIPYDRKNQIASCNLGTVSLKDMVHDKKFDFLKLGQAVSALVVSLNAMITASVNVDSKIKSSNDFIRPLGIGVSGFAEMMYKMDLTPTYYNDDMIPQYDPESLAKRKINPELQELNWKIWSCMYYYALKTSCNEAKVHGPCKGFDQSWYKDGVLQYHLAKQDMERMAEHGFSQEYKTEPWEPKQWGESGSWDELIKEIKQYGLRNLLFLSCQPTATSSQIVDNTESIEFPVSHMFIRKLKIGEYATVNPYLIEDLKEIGLWNDKVFNYLLKKEGSIIRMPEKELSTRSLSRLRFLKEKYLTMWEISPEINIQLAAQRQIFIDHTQSMNLFIRSPSVSQMHQLHLYAWRQGLKTGMYYLRSRAAGKILNFDNKPKVSSNIEESLPVFDSFDLKGKAMEEKKTTTERLYSMAVELTKAMEAPEPEPTYVCTKEEGCSSCA